MSRQARREIFECNHCGADVPIGAKVCRECGSDASTGWQDQAEIDYASVDLPDGYGAESGSRALPSSRRPWWIVVVAVLAAAALLWLTVLRR